MCVAHPRVHDCGHTSTQWNYCPSARFNQRTGLTEACGGATDANVQESTQKCPLKDCLYRSIPTGGYWVCCQCNGTNHGTSCIFHRSEPLRITNPATGESFLDYTCLHMMCRGCTLYGPDGSLFISSGKKRKDSGKDGRKSKDKDSGKKRDRHGESHRSSRHA
ncbi:hypothetical protein V8F20_012085 [Naviculisporaceae sp. PSN 640]